MSSPVLGAGFHEIVCGEDAARNNLLRQRLNGHLEHEEDDMDKDRIEGAAKQAKGAVKDAAGKVMGDTKMQAEGKADKAAGKVQNAVGGAKDAMRDKK
jgi:uncharacterized protein YjbJ (UPF0337 family)